MTTETPLIYRKMSDVMKDVKAVTKDQKNTAQGFKFRGIDQFVNALYPALTKHGVFMAPKCTYENHELKEVVRSSGKTGVDKHVTLGMCYTFYAEDGSNVVVGPIPSEGLDSGDKATNKALSAALKYALIQTFSVPTEDMAEADLDTPEIGTEAKSHTEPPKEERTAAKTAPTPEATQAPKKLSTFRKSKQIPSEGTTVLQGDGQNTGVTHAATFVTQDDGWK